MYNIDPTHGVLYRVDDSRRIHQTCDGSAAAMITNHDIRFKKAQNWMGLYPTLK